MNQHTIAVAPWLPLLLIASACEGAAEPTPEPEPDADPLVALQSAVDNSIIPAMVDFADGAAELHDAVGAFCESPSEDGLEALQDRWLSLSTSWNRAGIYFLGPLDDDIITPAIIFIESMRQRGMDYTNSVRDTLRSALTDDAPLDEAFFEDLQFNRVGLLALEVLLFEDSTRMPPDTDLAAVTEGYETSPRRCEYLAGIAELLRARAQAVEAGWTDAFLDTGLPFREVLLRNMLADGSEPVTAVLVAAIRHLEYLRVRKLNRIMDVAVASEARPDTSPFYDHLAAGLDGLEALMDPPDDDDGDAPGFLDVMSARGFDDEAEVVREAFEDARDAVEDQDREATAEALLALEAALRQEVPLGLGVDIGLTFSDGD